MPVMRSMCSLPPSNLPPCPGWNCAGKRESRRNRRPLYVIVLSSSRDETKLVEALDSGADDFVYKPPNRNELLRGCGRHHGCSSTAAIVSLCEFRFTDWFTEPSRVFRGYRAAGSPWCCPVGHHARHRLLQAVNDRHGHDAGDDVLGKSGLVSLGSIGDLPGWGARNSRLWSRPAAQQPASCGNHPPYRGGNPVQTCAGPLAVTLSIGVSAREADETFAKALKNADIALYASKSAGATGLRCPRPAARASCARFPTSRLPEPAALPAGVAVPQKRKPPDLRGAVIRGLSSIVTRIGGARVSDAVPARDARPVRGGGAVPAWTGTGFEDREVRRAGGCREPAGRSAAAGHR